MIGGCTTWQQVLGIMVELYHCLDFLEEKHSFFPIPSGKTTTKQWNIPMFNRKYIFKGSVFHCYVLPECTSCSAQLGHNPLQLNAKHLAFAIRESALLVGAQPTPTCSFARHLVGKIVIYCSWLLITISTAQLVTVSEKKWELHPGGMVF